MAMFKVRCATCDRRLGLGEDWIPAHQQGAFECTRCAAQRTAPSHPHQVTSAFVPPWHVLASLRLPKP